MTAPDQTNAEVSDERLREIAENYGYGRAEAQAIAAELLNRRSVTSQASEGDGRTMSGETVMGMPVTAYMEETEFGGKFATHWSTIPDHRNPVRLFAEPDVRERLAVAPVSKRVERLETALRPFADFVPNFFDDGYEDDDIVSITSHHGGLDLTLTVDDFRRAAKAFGDRS